MALPLQQSPRPKRLESFGGEAIPVASAFWIRSHGQESQHQAGYSSPLRSRSVTSMAQLPLLPLTRAVVSRSWSQQPDSSSAIP